MSLPETPDVPNPVPNFEIALPQEGVKRIYANVATITWGGSDLSVQLYQVVQPYREIPSQKHAPNHLLHSADVTVSWATAKIFHAQLGEVLRRYEDKHGSIRTEFEAI
jgi:hypothetical protein